MANQRIFLRHKLLSDFKVCIARRSGAEFTAPADAENLLDRFHETVYIEWLKAGPWDGHYDEGYYIELEHGVGEL